MDHYVLIKSIKFKFKFNQVETSDHFLFHCPQYEHLRLGWRWSHISKAEKRYRWVAEHLLDMRSFIKMSVHINAVKAQCTELKSEPMET